MLDGDNGIFNPDHEYSLMCDDECGKITVEDWGDYFTIMITRLDKFPFWFRFKRAMEILFNRVPYIGGDIHVEKETFKEFLKGLDSE